jgi:uncharacterized protein YbjT (DUF2867 family)
MATRSVATVFGGSGFIGRYVVQRLCQAGHIVRVAVRDTERALFLKPMGDVGQVVPLYCALGDEPTIARALAGAELAVNLVGLLTERRRGDFQRVHEAGAAAVARLAAAERVGRLVHVSAIGADPNSPSRYAATKGEGEAAVRAALPGATILRPSVVFGLEDQFFNRFGRIAELSPVMPVIAGATRFQPVYVGDVANAVIAGLERPDAAGALYELGGPRVLTMREVIAYVLAETRRRRPVIELPVGLARLQAAVLERLPGRLLTGDQLVLLQRDNVVSPGMPGLAELGITPTPHELVVASYLRRFRPGGGKREALDSTE